MYVVLFLLEIIAFETRLELECYSSYLNKETCNSTIGMPELVQPDRFLIPLLFTNQNQVKILC